MRSAIGSIQRLGKDYYRVSVEGKPKPDGSRYRPSEVVRGPRSKAEAVLARLVLDNGGGIDADMTVAEYWETFYRPSLDNLAPSTRHGYIHQYEKYVGPLFGDMMLDGLKARTIEAKLAGIEKPGAQRGAYKLLRQMVNEAYRDELVESNPFHRRIRLKRAEKYEPEVLLLEDVPAWLDAIYGAKYEPVLLVMLFGGLRREEACALFWSDIDFGVDLCAVRVDKTLVEVGGKLHEGPTKTPESRRTVFIAGPIAARLLELSGEGPLVPDANGNRMAPNRISNEYRSLVSKTDAKYVPMRNLRNSYATIMQGLGASDSLISKSLGHTNLKVDYAHYFAANAPAHMDNARLLGDSVAARCSTAYTT